MKEIRNQKIPIKIVEDHNQAYYFWKRLGLSDKPLIHLDAHIDFNFYPTKPFRQIVDEARSKEKLVSELSKGLLYKNMGIKEKSLTNIGNYIYPAMRDGIISDFYWVIPGDRDEFESSQKNLRNILKSFFRNDPFRTGKIKKEEGLLKTKIYNRDFIITTVQDIPENIAGAIVDVDCDFFTTETIKRADAARDIDKRFPWIWPQELVTWLKKNAKPSCITIAYSVNGGFTPLIYKFLGDETMVLFNGINQKAKEFILRKNEALIFFHKGKIREAIEKLKKMLQGLDTLRLGPGLKNRFKAHIAFVLFRCFAKLNELAKAGFYYNIAITSDKTYSVRDNNYGPLYLRRKGCLKKAEREFNIILSVDKNNPYALCGLADILMRRKDFKRARAFLKQAYSIDRRGKEALLGLGEVEILLKDYKKALKYLKDYKSKEERGGRPHFLLAQAYEGLGKFDEALKEYKFAHRFGINLNLYLRLFRLLEKSGIPERHRGWIASRINLYKDYRKRFVRLEKNNPRRLSRVDRITGRLINTIDRTLQRVQDSKVS